MFHFFVADFGGFGRIEADLKSASIRQNPPKSAKIRQNPPKSAKKD
jgi:hypothetical protein